MGNSIDQKKQITLTDEIKHTMNSTAGQYMLIRKDKTLELMNQWLYLVNEVDGTHNKKKVANKLFHCVQLIKPTILTNENLAKAVRKKCLEMISQHNVEGAVDCYIDLFGYDDIVQEALNGQQVFEEGTNNFKPVQFVIIDIKT
jgi:hypothetical protein